MKKYVVIGASGFLGQALADKLLTQGHTVAGVSRRKPEVLIRRGLQHFPGDIADISTLSPQAFSGADAVFHTAAHVEMWGKKDDFYRTNVVGTKNIISLCKENGVGRLVYTSSPSVVADGNDLCGIDESYPYPKQHTAYYPETKSIAERMVLAENSSSLQTLALRPHLIFGPGDTNLVPTIIDRARANRLVRIGSGMNLSDFSYIEDCVEAHVAAARALETNPNSRGRAFFISQGEPWPLWGFIEEVLKRSAAPAPKRTLTKTKAMSIAKLCELAAKVGLVKEPLLTRFLVSEMTTHHYFDIGAAKRELGYAPRYTVGQALDLTFPETATAAAIG